MLVTKGRILVLALIAFEIVEVRVSLVLGIGAELDLGGKQRPGPSGRRGLQQPAGAVRR